MSLDSLRDATLRAKRIELAQCENTRKRKLRELYRYTAYFSAASPLNVRDINLPFDTEPDQREHHFLDANDLSKGRLFRDATLPYPALKASAHDPAPSTDAQRVSSPVKSIVDSSATRASSASLDTSAQTLKPSVPSSSPALAPPAPSHNPPVDPNGHHPPFEASSSTQPVPKQPSRPSNAPDVDLKVPDHAGKQRDGSRTGNGSGDLLKDVKAAQRQSFSDEKSTPLNVQIGADAASSPSSTVGPYSTTTPRPAQQSPDTSPDQHAFDFESSSARKQPPPRNAPFAEPPKANRASEKALSHGGLHGEHRQRSDEVLAPATALDNARRGLDRKVSRDDVPTPPPDVDMEDAVESSNRATHLSTADVPGTPDAHDANNARVPTVHDDGTAAQNQAALTPESGTVALLNRSNLQKIDPKPLNESKQYAVVFPPKNNGLQTDALQQFNEEYASMKGASLNERKDYLYQLFVRTAHQNARIPPLNSLFNGAGKVLSTSNFVALTREEQDHQYLKRLYQLQNANRWPLRQIAKAVEPHRPITHHDHLLAEVKWMRTDFREERKWKTAMAKTFVNWCLEWFQSTPERRKELQVKTASRTPIVLEQNDQDGMTDAHTPELTASGSVLTEGSLDDDDQPATPSLTVNPADLFTLGYSDVVLHLEESANKERLFMELPEYDPTAQLEEPELLSSEPSILPVTKWLDNKILSYAPGPHLKRSRYDYDQEEVLTDYPSKRPTPEHSRPSTPGRRLNRDDLPPEKTDCALFQFENKHMKDRLYIESSMFRNPTEFPMPSVAFMESRISSQWHWEEDQRLRSLVKEFQYNWSLISSQLTIPSLFTSSYERRTPWECFERWMQMEGLPGNYAKSAYFKTYAARLESAQRTVSLQHEAAKQAAAQAHTPVEQQKLSLYLRRKQSQPIRVEKRRHTRHLAMIDAFKKNARKKEAQAVKQAESQRMAALRKEKEQSGPKIGGQSRTPAEFSKAKYERELAAEERHRENLLRQREQMMQLRQQQMGMQGPMNMQRAAQLSAAQQAAMNAPNGQARANVTGQGNAGSPGAPPNMAMQGRQHPNQAMMQASIASGQNMNAVQMGANGVPQAQMQMPSQQRAHSNQDSMRLAAMQQRAQQQAMAQQQYQLQQQQLNNPNTLANAHLAGTQLAMQNPNVMAAMAANKANGNLNSNVAANAGSSASPRPHSGNQQAASMARPLSSGHVPAINNIAAALRTQNPTWSDEQINKAANEQLAIRFRQQQAQQAAQVQQRQNALNAAAGNMYPQTPAMMGGNTSPNDIRQMNQAQYMQNMMRGSVQLQQRPSAGSSNMGSARPPSRSATPQNPQQQPSQQSPNLAQAQAARN